MTAHQETRFRCDRCGVDEVVPIVNSGPVERRIAGPEDWMMLRLGHDTTAAGGAPKHLCPKCTDAFTAFMTVAPPVD